MSPHSIQICWCSSVIRARSSPKSLMNPAARPKDVRYGSLRITKLVQPSMRSRGDSIYSWNGQWSGSQYASMPYLSKETLPTTVRDRILWSVAKMSLLSSRSRVYKLLRVNFTPVAAEIRNSTVVVVAQTWVCSQSAVGDEKPEIRRDVLSIHFFVSARTYAPETPTRPGNVRRGLLDAVSSSKSSQFKCPEAQN